MSRADLCVEAVEVRKAFRRTLALDGATVAARAGQVTAVLGPNGAGKTTLMEICEGLLTADSGTVRVLGLDPARDGARLRPRVGVMVQDGGLPTSALPMELLRHVSRMYARPADVAALAGRLGIEAYARTPVRRLSGGQRQRLALAIALVGRPDLVFLDEPSAGLDPAARRSVWEMIADLREQGTSVVLTSHLMDEVEHLADHVVVLDGGRVLAEGTVTSLTAGAAQGDSTSVRVTGRISPGQQAELARWAAQRGLRVSERTLEDVFLDLTGRTLQ